MKGSNDHLDNVTDSNESSAATSSHVKTERYIRDVPGGYEKVTVERFKGERPASPAASVRLDPKFSRSARVKRATLCRWFGHKPDPFEAWIGPAGADDEDGTTFDLCICGRCYVRVRGCGGAPLRYVAIFGGGDWYDASVDHVVVPADLDLEAARERYRTWYKDEYSASFGPDPANPHRRTQLTRVPYWSFAQYLKAREGASPADIEEVWS